jgi:hypothetical protein
MLELGYAEENTCPWKEDLIDRQLDGRVVLRTLLVGRDNFLRSIAADDCAYSLEVKQAYASLDMPEWLWLVEVTAAGFYGSAMMKLGEVVINPAAEEGSFAGPDCWSAIVAIHVPGAMWPTPAVEKVVYVEDDQPSRVYSRPAFSERLEYEANNLASFGFALGVGGLTKFHFPGNLGLPLCLYAVEKGSEQPLRICTHGLADLVLVRPRDLWPVIHVHRHAHLLQGSPSRSYARSAGQLSHGGPRCQALGDRPRSDQLANHP